MSSIGVPARGNNDALARDALVRCPLGFDPPLRLQFSSSDSICRGNVWRYISFRFGKLPAMSARVGQIGIETHTPRARAGQAGIETQTQTARAGHLPNETQLRFARAGQGSHETHMSIARAGHSRIETHGRTARAGKRNRNPRRTMSQISVPWLRKGKGETPADGGCILQVIDFVNRNEWTDRPPCVHPVIANLAIYVNDALPDGERRKLLDLAPRLIGTASQEKLVSVRLGVFCARYVLPVFEAEHPGDERPRKAIEAVEAWCECPCGEHGGAVEAAMAAAAAVCATAGAPRATATAVHDVGDAVAAYAPQAAQDAADAANCALGAVFGTAAAYDFLLAVLDEYDKLVGRAKVESVDLEPVARMLEEARA